MKIKEPKVLQLIDSLATGGAERVSVNLANALAEQSIKSYLCATRTGGALEQFIDQSVTKLILNKSSAVDLKALFTLVKFIRKNKINIIHAHSSSFFMAVLCKLFTGVKVIWHDHNGNRYKWIEKQNSILKLLSVLFDFVLVVNEELKNWSKKNLKVESDRIVYLQNFPELNFLNSNIDLPGTKDTRIVCLANLRWQKDHVTLLNAFNTLVKLSSKWHLLLVGEDKKDSYSNTIKNYIKKQHLQENVHILGSRSDTSDILADSTIGVLSSESEGLPMTLLEYGLANLPVICTDVGQCSDVLGGGSYGKLIPVKDSEALASAMKSYINDEQLRHKDALAFHAHVKANYSKEAIVEQLLCIYEKVLHV